MHKWVIVLSGRIRSGKTTLAENMQKRFDAEIVKTRELIAQLTPDVRAERKALQVAGERLDKKTKGKWLLNALRRLHPDWFTDASPQLLVIDSARIQSQIDDLRTAFGKRLVHVHLTATAGELAKRYKRATTRIHELSSYEAARKSPTERVVDSLREQADIVIDTDQNSALDVLTRAAARVGLMSKFTEPLVDIVVGAQYGSEGKGNLVSYLAPEYEYLMRVGSVNAGHQVYLDPIYTFKQLPSGTLHNEQAKLILGPGTQIRLDVLQREIGECHVTFDRLFIDPQAMIIEKRDVSWEGRNLQHIGSTAQGVGHAAARRILRGADVRLAADIPALKPYLKYTAEVLEKAYASGSRILLEGTQGTSLSLYHGFYPHVTSRDTTAAGCMAEAGIPPKMTRRIVMVTRSHPIRVQKPKDGDSGYMSQEIDFDVISKRSGIPVDKLKTAELTSTTKRQRRIAEFDWAQLRKSALLNAPTDVALTFVDYLFPANKDARRFEQLHDSTINFIEEIERVAASPVSLISTRFHYRNIIDRRRW